VGTIGVGAGEESDELAVAQAAGGLERHLAEVRDLVVEGDGHGRELCLDGAPSITVTLLGTGRAATRSEVRQRRAYQYRSWQSPEARPSVLQVPIDKAQAGPKPTKSRLHSNENRQSMQCRSEIACACGVGESQRARDPALR